MNVHSFSAATVDGADKPLADYAGDMLLIVNVASKCGLTPQYEGLEALNRSMGGRGLKIVGFPCNQFGGQEPGTDDEIQDFCSVNYDVTFPIFAKVDVNGPDADPLFSYLRSEAPGDFNAETGGGIYQHLSKNYPELLDGDQVKWNFTKFLVSPEGEVIKRYEPTVSPDAIGVDVEQYLPA